MADRNGAVVRPWMKQAEEAKLKSEAEKAAAAKAAFDATFKDVDKIKLLQGPPSSSDSEEEEAEDRLACKPIGPTDPGRCTAAGPGMGGGAACAPCTFTVTTKDSDGRKIPTGGADIKVKVTPGTSVGGADIEGIVKDQGDGAYAVTYVVPKRGNYMVKVECNGKPIMGSPFPVFFSAGTATGGLLGLAPTTTYPNLVNQNMPNMPNYSASVSGAFPGLLGMIPGLVPGPSGGVILPGVGASLGEVCREYLNGQCFKTDCKFNHPQHNLLMTAIAATTNMGSLSQAPMPPSAAAMAAAQAIMAAQALQAHASQHAQSQTPKDSSGTSEKERQADALKKTLQVSNLSPILTVDQLKQLFGYYGTVVDCTVTDSKHFAYIEYSKPEEATAALALNNMDVGGRPLNVEMAKSLPPKPVIPNSSLGSSSLPIMMQQAVAMQQMQFQQALLMQQTMAAQQAANRAATVKSATEIASARAAEISRRLKAEGLGNDDKETDKKSRSPSTSRARSKSRSKSPIHRRRQKSRSSSPVSHRPRNNRSKSPVRSRHRSRSFSPLVRRSRTHRSRSPLRSRHYSNYDDYGRRSYRDSRDGSGRFRRLDSRGSHNHHSFVSRRSRSISPRGRKSYRDDSDSSRHRRPRSPGNHRGNRKSPLMEDQDKLRRRRSRSTSVDSKHRSNDRREEKKKAKNHALRRSESISPEGKTPRASLSPLSSDETKSKHHKRSRSRSLDAKYGSKNRDGECKDGELKHRGRRRSKSTERKVIKTTSTQRSDKNKYRERKRSRSRSVEGDLESDGDKDRNRHGKHKHQDRRRSGSKSVEGEQESDGDKDRNRHGKQKRHDRRCSRSKSLEADLESDGDNNRNRLGKQKHQDRRRSRSKSAEDDQVFCKDKDRKRPGKQKHQDRRRSRSKSVEDDQEFDGDKDRKRPGKQKHQDRRRSRSASADVERPIGRSSSCRIDKSKHKYRRRSRSRSGDKHMSDDSTDAAVQKSKLNHGRSAVTFSFEEPKDSDKNMRELADEHESDDSSDARVQKSKLNHGRSAGTDCSSEEPKHSDKNMRELADDGTTLNVKDIDNNARELAYDGITLNFSCEQGSSMVETGKADTENSAEPVIDNSYSGLSEGIAKNCA